MKKEQVLELINSIAPDLIEEADIQAPARRRLPKIARTGLVAACLCLALVGTAAAANLIAGFYRMESVNHSHFPHTTSQYYNGYTLWGDYSRIPLDAFSPELLEFTQQHSGEIMKLPASDLSQLEQQTGLDLPDIPVHDELRLSGFTPWLSVNLNGQPSGIDYYQDYMGVGAENHTLKLTFGVSLYTEAAPVKDPWITILFPEGHVVETEEYSTESGLPVLLSTCHIPDDYLEPDIVVSTWGRTYYRVIFMLDGVQYTVDAKCPDNPDRALTVLKEFIEGFHS